MKADLSDLTWPLERLATTPPDVVVIGSGPAGVAVAEHLFETAPQLTVGVLERGGILTLSHFNNLLPNSRRRQFLNLFGEHPWEGDLRSGMMLYALGGRGIAAGGHLRRFDPVDYDLWAPSGLWPQSVVDALDRLYPTAEQRRCVSPGEVPGRVQALVCEKLSRWRPVPPPVGVDFSPTNRFTVGRGYDSSVFRLWRLILQDRLGDTNRMRVATHTYVRRAVQKGSHIEAIECIDRLGVPHFVRAKSFVLAASPVESARLVLHSGVETSSQAVGRYLAEHIERRAKVVLHDLGKVSADDAVSLVLMPIQGEARDHAYRFQVHLRGEVQNGSMVVDIGGFAAMDPNPANVVTLSTHRRDDFDVPLAHAKLALSEADELRARALEERILEVAHRLGGGRFITEQFPYEVGDTCFAHGNSIQVMPKGRSYHEAGTLRLGSDPRTAVTDESGKVYGVDNLFVADAGLFPCVGVANPMLTVTALGYRVAEAVAAG